MSMPNPMPNNCDFSFVNSEHSQTMLENGYKAISLTENWNFIYNLPDDFSYSDKRIFDISNKMEELGYNGHSGNSFIYVIMNMRLLSRIGYEKYKQNFINNRK